MVPGLFSKKTKMKGRNNEHKKKKKGHDKAAPGHDKNVALKKARETNSKHLAHSFGPWHEKSAREMGVDELRWMRAQEGAEPSPAAVRVVSWNILAPAYCFNHFYKHLERPGATLAWPRRSKMILDALGRMDGDVVCLQEVENWQQLQTSLAGLGYDGVWQGRTGHKTDGVAILWKREKFAAIGEKEALLFNSVLGKHGEDRVAVRICLTLLEDPERRLTVATTHLDDKRPRVQVDMCRLFADFVREGQSVARDAIVACGDFNCTMESEAVQLFLETAQKMESALPQVDPLGYPVSSACIGNPANIDHMFYDPAFFKLSGIVAPLMSSAKMPNDLFPSDHAMVGAEFEFIKRS